MLPAARLAPAVAACSLGCSGGSVESIVLPCRGKCQQCCSASMHHEQWLRSALQLSSQQHSQVSQPHRLDAIHMAIVCSSTLESLPVPIVAAPAPAPAPAPASASASLFILQAEAAICAASPFCMCCGECPVQLLTRPSQQEAACEPSSSAAHRQQFCPSRFPGASQTVAHISHQVCCEGLPLHCPCMVVPVHCRLQLQRKPS